MRLAARMKLLFIAAINHVYYCNSWRPTRSHNPAEDSCDWRYGYREDTFAKGHLYFMAEFTAWARETDVCVFVGSSWDGRSCLDPHPGCDQQDETLQHGPAAWPCCWQGDCACVSQKTGFASFLGDEGSQFGDQDPNWQLPPSSGFSVSCANRFTQNTVANKGRLYLLAPVPVCLFGLWFLSALVHLTYPMGWS